jgi:uncharacterized protein (UPF0276 family)
LRDAGHPFSLKTMRLIYIQISIVEGATPYEIVDSMDENSVSNIHVHGHRKAFSCWQDQ